MAKRYDISYMDAKSGTRIKSGSSLTQKGAKKVISKLKKSRTFRALGLSNPRMYRRK